MSGADLDRIRESGLFDRAYYTSTYREDIPAEMDPFEHFVSIGLDRGFKPNPRFDPLVYRLLHPGAGDASLLLHFLDHHPGRHDEFSLQDALRLVEKTATFLPVKTFDISLEDSNRNNLAAAAAMADVRVSEFTVGDRPYRLTVPPADDLLNRLRDNRPFAFARLSHGDWDDLYVYERYRGRVARAVSGRGLGEEHIDRLTMRLCDQFNPDEGVFAENFLPELLGDLRSHRPSADFMRSVGFKGFPTADEQLFYRTLRLKPVDVARLRIFSEHFDPAETLYDANLFKRWGIAGQLKHLPDLARERPVVFMGAERLASLGLRWQLPWLLHLRIPPENSYPLRHVLLDRAREFVAEANAIARRHGTKRPLFLLQGSSFAYWMIDRLRREHPDIFYLDLGLALHIWFYDRPDMPVMPERTLYGRAIVRNCELEDFYRRLGTPLPPELSETSPD